MYVITKCKGHTGHERTGNFLLGGCGEPFAQKTLLKFFLNIWALKEILAKFLLLPKKICVTSIFSLGGTDQVQQGLY